MKRRKFLQGFVAGAATAALPAPVLAKAAAASAAKVVPFHYGWACVYARTNGGISAADIERVFRVSPKEASRLMDRMLARSVLRPAAANGKCHPTRTWEPWDQKTTVVRADTHQPTDTSTNTTERGQRARTKFHAMIQSLKQEPEYRNAA